ncbi:MAG: hypothetical protein WCC73_11675, partial [Terracidiphilus sp.]
MTLSRFVQRLFPALTLFVVLSFLACGIQPPVQAQDKPILITSAVTIVESAQEPGPVHRATQDLVSDLTKVFGRAPKMVKSLDASGPV